MAILSGCDYLDNIQGLGIKKAHQLMRKYKNVDKVVKFLRLDGQFKVPLGYSEACRRAELTFIHQRVFCPKSRKLVHLEPLPAHLLTVTASIEEALRFVGPDLDDEVALGIALGELCPLSKAKMVDIAPGQDVLAQLPTAAPQLSAKAVSIKDWFKPDPSAASARKPPAKRERAPLVPQITTPGPMGEVKSRFFGSAIAGPSGLRKRAPSGKPDQMVADVDLTLEERDLQGDSKQDQMLITSQMLVISPAPGNLGSTPPRSLVLSPVRPWSSQQPLSESGFSHISSPSSSPGAGKGKGRAAAEDSGYAIIEGDDFDDSAQGALPPRGPYVDDSVSPKHPSVASDFVDVTSPEVSLPVQPNRTGHTCSTSREPSSSKRKREGSEIIAWTSDSDQPLQVQDDQPRLPCMQASESVSPPPKRRNATLPTRRAVKAERQDRHASSDLCIQVDQTGQQCIINDWRVKFSSSSVKLVSLSHPSRLYTLLTHEQSSSGGSSLVLPGPSGSRKRSSRIRLIPQDSRVDLSDSEKRDSRQAAPRKGQRLVPDSFGALPSAAELLSSASDLSEATSSSLEAFRFRPIQHV